MHTFAVSYILQNLFQLLNINQLEMVIVIETLLMLDRASLCSQNISTFWHGLHKELETFL